MVIEEEFKKVVIARLQLLPIDKKISVGSYGDFTRDDLIKRVEKGDEVGKKMVKIELEFLRSLKKGLIA